MELIVVLVIAILVIGPERTIVYARKAGKWLRVLRIYIGSMTEELRETVVEPLQELQEPLKEIAQPFDEISREVTGTVREISKPFDDAVNDVKKSTNEMKGTAVRNLTAGKKTDSADNTSSGEPDIQPEEELEMAQIIEDDPAPTDTSPAIADIEEAGGTTQRPCKTASA